MGLAHRHLLHDIGSSGRYLVKSEPRHERVLVLYQVRYQYVSTYIHAPESSSPIACLRRSSIPTTLPEGATPTCLSASFLHTWLASPSSQLHTRPLPPGLTISRGADLLAGCLGPASLVLHCSFHLNGISSGASVLFRYKLFSFLSRLSSSPASFGSFILLYHGLSDLDTISHLYPIYILSSHPTISLL